MPFVGESLRFRIGLMVLLCAGTSTGCRTEDNQPTYSGPLPDVVIVMVDTLRADFVDWDPGGGTPFLAKLAEESVVFEDASSAAPWTLPSIASLVTGRHVVEHGVVQETRRLPSKMKTLAERLSARGYATRAFYRNAFAGPMCDLDRGYEFSARSPFDSGGTEILPLLKRSDGRPDERPLLLYVHNAEPHDPQDKPSNNSMFLSDEELEFVKWYGQTVSNYRVLTRRNYQYSKRKEEIDFDAEQARLVAELGKRQEAAHRIYARAVKESDERVESIVAELRARGRWEQTLFIVVADHGEEMGEHDGWLHDQSLYQELVHIPFIVRFPGGEYAGTRIDDPASLVDLLPTVLGVVGMNSREGGLEGRDWSSVLAGQETGTLEPRVVSMRINERKRFGPWQRERGDRNVAVRAGKWKAIWSVGLDRLELYDTEHDPGELRDLSESEPELGEELAEVARAAWGRMKDRSQVVDGEGFEGLDEGALQNLEELGYIGGE